MHLVSDDLVNPWPFPGGDLWGLRLSGAGELSLHRRVLPRSAPRCLGSQAAGGAQLRLLLQGVRGDGVLLGKASWEGSCEFVCI